ncbi:MAG: AAC(3) family N-acetyltransferase [Planctomycetota bacterium]
MTHSFSYQTFSDALKRSGVRRGGRVLVHTSLRAIVPDDAQRHTLPDGGMPDILRAFQDIITPDGLLAVPTFSPTWADRPEMKQSTIWDGRLTPSWLGAFPNFIIQQPDFYRSAHPTHNLCVWGKGAETFVQGHDYWKPYFGKDTPWGRFYSDDFDILMVGSWLNGCTAIHMVEEWLDLPFMQNAKANIRDANGEVKVVDLIRGPLGPRSFYHSKGNKFEDKILAEHDGIFKREFYGDCRIVNVKFRALVDAVVEMDFDDPLILLDDPATCEFTRRYADATIAAVARHKSAGWRF